MDWTTGIHFPAGTGIFSHCYHFLTGSVAQPTSYQMDTRVSFAGGTVAKA